MKGCLVALLATVGVLLLFPGLCFLMFGDLIKAETYGGVILARPGCSSQPRSSSTSCSRATDRPRALHASEDEVARVKGVVTLEHDQEVVVAIAIDVAHDDGVSGRRLAAIEFVDEFAA